MCPSSDNTWVKNDGWRRGWTTKDNGWELPQTRAAQPSSPPSAPPLAIPIPAREGGESPGRWQPQHKTHDSAELFSRRGANLCPWILFSWLVNLNVLKLYNFREWSQWQWIYCNLPFAWAKFLWDVPTQSDPELNKISSGLLTIYEVEVAEVK